MGLDERASLRALRAAREVTRVASQLAYEAASLAQMFEDPTARQASVGAAQASVQSARRAFQMDDEAPTATTPPAESLALALRLSRDALDEATEAIAAARTAVDAAIAFHARVDGAGGADAGADG